MSNTKKQNKVADIESVIKRCTTKIEEYKTKKKLVDEKILALEKKIEGLKEELQILEESTKE